MDHLYVGVTNTWHTSLIRLWQLKQNGRIQNNNLRLKDVLLVAFCSLTFLPKA